MKLHAMAVYDVKVEAYLAPFFARTLGEAERFWRDMLSNKEGPFGKHPEDYQLFRVGEFDESTGLLVGVEEFVKVSGLSLEVPNA